MFDIRSAFICVVQSIDKFEKDCGETSGNPVDLVIYKGTSKKDNDNWYLDWIVITTAQGDTYTFDYYNWIASGAFDLSEREYIK